MINPLPPHRNIAPYGSSQNDQHSGNNSHEYNSANPANNKTYPEREHGKTANDQTAAAQMVAKHRIEEQNHAIKQRAKYDYEAKKRIFDNNKKEITQFEFEVKRLRIEIDRVKFEIESTKKAKLGDGIKTEAAKKDYSILVEKIKEFESQLVQLKKAEEKAVASFKSHEAGMTVVQRNADSKKIALEDIERKKKNEEIVLERLRRQVAQAELEVRRYNSEIARMKSEIDALGHVDSGDKLKKENIRKESIDLAEKIRTMELQLVQMKKDHEKRIADMRERDIASLAETKSLENKTNTLGLIETKKRNDEIALDHLKKQNEMLEREMKELETKMK